MMSFVRILKGVALFLFLCMGMPKGISQPQLTPNELVSQGFAGTYKGKLYDLRISGKPKKEVPNISVRLEVNSHQLSLYLPAFKVGKMPGELSIRISHLDFDPQQGTFSATIDTHPEQLAQTVLLSAWFGDYRNDTTFIKVKITPTAKGNQLSFTLECEGTMLMIKMLKVHISFIGIQQ